MSSSEQTSAGTPPPLPPGPNISRSQTPISYKRSTQFDECIWASDFSEIQQACYLSRVCTSSRPKYCRFRNIPSILQEGPTCGLTAISMVFNGDPTSAEILEIAKKKELTYNGEMFSAKNLYRLITDLIEQRKFPIQCQLHEGQLNCAKVKSDLESGSCIFVPYDPDYNHAPCLKNGHKAHWALVIGYLVDNDDQFYVISRHGKARNVAIWSLEDLSASNSNLFEFYQPKSYPNLDFLLPIGGIGGEHGLRDRSIIISGIESAIITLD